MATRTSYIVAGVAVAAAVFGFAGYKFVETRKSNDDQELVVTGSDSFAQMGNSAGAPDTIENGGSLGDINPTGGQTPPAAGGDPLSGFQQGGRGAMGGRRGEMGGGSPAPSDGTGARPVQPRQNGQGGRNPAAAGGSGSGGATERPAMDIFGMGSMILSDAKVQAELKLTAAQKSAITQALAPPKEDANASPDDMQGQALRMMNRSEESGKKIKAILNDSQEKRYTELVYQTIGPASMMNGSMAEEFGVSEDEAKKIREVMNGLAQAFQGGQMPKMEDIIKMKADMDKKIVAAVDEDTRKKWKAATGAPFTFSNPMGGLGGMMGGFGGRGGGGAGGRRGG